MARAAVAGADAGRCVARAWPAAGGIVRSAAAWHLISAGKAAGPMMLACLAAAPRPPARAMAVARERPVGVPEGVECFAGGHPTPNAGSAAAGRRALDIAAGASEDDVLVVLLSGGASAVLEVPADPVTLDDLGRTTDRLLRAGADIAALNAVRKHLSLIKGGRLAAACRGRTIALVISDVVGDDLSVIGSGPTVADPSTYAEALAVLVRFGGLDAFPAVVVDALALGARGSRPETPKPGSSCLGRTSTTIVGSRADAINGARLEAESRGYDVDVLETPVTGEARAAAQSLLARVRSTAQRPGRRRCLLSGGETTVSVTGQGRGGRNQEFALAMAVPLASLGAPAVVASIGTDGIDGPTDAAGAFVDSTTISRAAAAGLQPPQTYLDDNDSYSFFEALGDLIVTGPTRTNVGDVQVTLLLPGDAI